MGKRKQASKYEHNHTYNPRARESDDRKIESLKKLELKRLQSAVVKAKEAMQSYVPPESRKKYKIDPMYDLKGAARVAREFYRPADYREEVEPVDLLEQYHGKLWNHEDGQKVLSAMMELGVAMHNSLNKGKEAIKIFQEMIELDNEDHLLSRHRLLRCYLDRGDALQARLLLEKYSSDTYSCYAYSRMLIEFIALSLEEDDASEEVRDEMMKKAIEANPHTVWAIAYHEVFAECVQHLDQLQSAMPSSIAPGSVEDAFMFFDVDLPLWQETDGLIDYVRDYIEVHELAPPLIAIDDDEEVEGESKHSDVAAVSAAGGVVASNGDNAETAPTLSPKELHTMYVDMFVTAMEMVEDQMGDVEQQYDGEREVDSVSGSGSEGGDCDSDSASEGSGGALEGEHEDDDEEGSEAEAGEGFGEEDSM